MRLALDERGRKGDRWRRIALSAAKQSGRNILPIVDDPTGLDDICRELMDYDRVVIAWEEADKRADGTPLSVTDALEGCDIDSHVALVIGPEGGLTAEEVEAIKALGSFVKIVSLGELILRTETAGTVATALCMYTASVASATIARDISTIPRTRGLPFRAFTSIPWAARSIRPSPRP